MGCFGIGVTRLAASAVEVLSTEDEMRWPTSIAPYKLCVISPKVGVSSECSMLIRLLDVDNCICIEENRGRLPLTGTETLV